MTNDALLQRIETPRPDVTAGEAAAILETFYGLRGEIVELGSQQDRNYRISSEEGRFVLKICRSDYATVELEAQNAAMLHISGKQGAPRVPLPRRARNGDDILFLAVGGVDYQVRLLSYLDGEPLTRRKHLSRPVVEGLGALAARVALHLADFSHPGLEREVQWDLRRAGPVALKLLSAVSDQARRDRIAKVMVAAVKRLQPLAPELRVQPIHHDITDDNVVARPDAHGRMIADGVIDFGDIVHGWLAADLAVTCASLLHHADGDPFYILPCIRAFHAIHPLTEAEARALWPLIVARAAILAASGEMQLSIDPDNTYVQDNLAHEREIFELAARTPHALMETAILEALGLPVEELALPEMGPLLPGIQPEAVRFADFTVTSRGLVRDNWASPQTELKLLEQAARETGIAIARYGEHRLTRTELLSPREPESVALHLAICLPAGFQAAAPFAGRIERDGQRTVLVGAGLALHLEGLDAAHESGLPVEAGEPIGTVSGEAGRFGHLAVQLSVGGGFVPPLFSTPSHAAAWKRLSPSPSLLLGLDCDAPPLEGDRVLARRHASFAQVQKNYYRDPPQIERGWREFMFDTRGRAYVDMLNNVAIAGHGHPRLAEAAGHQWSLLNTNSRFHYAGIADFSERLASLAPEGLDTVLLVNSGSEAVDLALRLAWAWSGAKNIVSLLEAYHGWTVASDAVSTSIADNPAALTTRPAWVHPVVSPNTYRGPYRGPDSAPAYAAHVRQALELLDVKGEKLAGFICETVYGNAGGIALPNGYLAEVYAMIRQRGGLCIADEVQVGYGRLGHSFWGFEQQGVVPDIITVAKGMGNGHPLGAVITRREVADALEREGYFFSSAGGSPVSCAIGMTVLDIMEDEGLQENARIVGDHLKARLESLCQRHALAGAVHGMGLYLGLEFVRDRNTLAPATQETAAICDRLLDFGILMQPTGDHLNVLKIKPPLCLTVEAADFFVDMLDRVLSDGW
ncbi:aminotransferase [Gellertiella hungarica]|uniref:4-aminobutyrate aminotransferase-like enzyme/Ser/Thr protein kinase RdoA (MazF antagonist) n=1 Tax=Gellertiella hungarica TaxID=1572859 RepID=A0A7W6J7R8_9HYPH|nr:aminotransferase [Gellertiella hungarica]MBB4066386.1 4-aminobutyrate aminotransferase-like enzyme/Ser/Thr protein kinase RdoA (MazF antagonist) [Gellertiella hungarica]